MTLSATTVDESGHLVGTEKSSSLWKDAIRRLMKNRMAVVSLIFLGVCIVLALFTPWVAPYSFEAIDYHLIGQAPSWSHWFGTDVLGRDLFTRTLYGMRISLAVGAIATLVSFFIGITWGAVSGFVGGKVDYVMMRFVDIMYSLPYMFFVIILMTIFGRNVFNLFLALGAVQWLTMSRIVRGQVLSLKHKEFVEAARSIGLSKRAILFKHIVPNTLGPVIIYVTLTIPRIILEEAFLSFLGLGVQPPMASLGSLASDGAQGMEMYPWLIIFPGLTLAAILFALNYLGDGLRDALDPRMGRE
ncbi:MAG: peptide ABC transporter permease [Deltaproteobacteria bacterium CG11_big_fil_rev_8_21_14_0_20_47_16]|nr:MAG: peptide ABC transporter permease [Deltaproteobacteria bacterium CG11_big_fil_rev_8_21_14_0_20_47_16]